MRHLFTFLLVVLGATSFAQGNLQFNQVLNFDYSVTLGPNADALVGTLTVPAGKVWKITAASSQDVSNNEYSTAIAVNNHLLYQYYYRANSAAVSNNTPYWLAPGNHVVEISNLYTGTITGRGSLSVIEFNVVP